jgi:hypothetical protein
MSNSWLRGIVVRLEVDRSPATFAYSFHPNLKGQQAMANLVDQHLNEIMEGTASSGVDGDGNADLVFVGPRNRVCLGDGSGSFTCSDINTGISFFFDVALGDVNSDGNLDAVFANTDDLDPARNRVCLGDGSGGFTCSDVSTDIDDSRSATLCREGTAEREVIAVWLAQTAGL